MVSEKEIIEYVKDSLKKHNINDGDYDSLKKKLQEQLFQIENYIQTSISKQKEILNDIKDSKLNLLTVVKGSNVQRSSVYNSVDVLKKYIEARIEEVEKEDILSLNKYKKQQENFELLKEYMEKLQDNLIDNEILEMKNNELEKEIMRLNKIQENLILELNQLKRENKELKNKNDSNNILKIKRNI